jgi:hypothetical protein
MARNWTSKWRNKKWFTTKIRYAIGRGPWIVRFVVACNCCLYTYRYGTRREARLAHRRFREPLRSYGGRLTKMFRDVSPVARA